MQVMSKMSLQEYASYLPDFDMGMSLMLTPHPSLVPLEMAGAGLVTITNSYANKTAARLRAISANFEVGEPNVEDLVAAIMRAEERIEDVAGRVRGADIDWPTSWDNAIRPEDRLRLFDELRAGKPAEAVHA